MGGAIFAIAARLKHMLTPGNPPAGQLAFYAKSDDRLYTKNSAGTEGGLAMVSDLTTITGSTFQTAASGERIVVRNDGSGGIIESFSGLSGEVAGAIDPAVQASRPSLHIYPGTTATYVEKPQIFMHSNIAASSSFELGAETVSIKKADMSTAGSLSTGTLFISGSITSGDVGTGTFRDSVDARVIAVGCLKAAVNTNLTLSGAQTIDGVSCVAGDVVGAFGQTTTANCGIYLVAAGAWTRVGWADSSAEVASLGTVQVQSGTVNGGSRWATSFKSTDTIGTTAMKWFTTDGRLQNWTPTFASGGGGSFTTPPTINSAQFSQSGQDWVDYELEVTMNTIGAATGALVFTLPVAAGGVAGRTDIGGGRETQTTGSSVRVTLGTTTSLGAINTYNNGSILVASYRVGVSGRYKRS